MFDRLLDLLRNIWQELIPCYVVKETQMSCVFRFGKYKTIKNPGLHFKIPFIDQADTYHTKTRTIHLNSQTLTTLDGKQMVIKAIARFHVYDIKKYSIEVWSAEDALCDTIQGVIGNIVKKTNYENVILGIEDAVFKQSSDGLKDWGIMLERITFSDMAQVKSLRLINDKK